MEDREGFEDLGRGVGIKLTIIDGNKRIVLRIGHDPDAEKIAKTGVSEWVQEKLATMPNTPEWMLTDRGEITFVTPPVISRLLQAFLEAGKEGRNVLIDWCHQIARDLRTLISLEENWMDMVALPESSMRLRENLVSGLASINAANLSILEMHLGTSRERKSRQQRRQAERKNRRRGN